jgi:hypothetical protein
MLACSVRWLVLLAACNAGPLDLPENKPVPVMKRSPDALVMCGPVSCDRGQFCCTHDDGYHGTCLDPSAINDCYTFFGCDGPEDCINGAVCCESYEQFNGSACADPSSCNDAASWLMCHHDSDCPSSAPHCCPHPDSGLGRCMPYCYQ